MIRLSSSGFGLPQIHTRGLGMISFLYADTFWIALRNYLKSAEPMADLTEIYFRQAAPRYTLPILIYTPIADTPELNNSETYWERSVVQFTILSYSDVQADTLGLNLYKVLAPKIYTDGVIVPRVPIKAVDSYEMAAIPGIKHRATQAGRGPGNRIVWAFHCQFSFLIGRSMIPT
ncbi:hypothetical protein V5E97_06735 [Singulisphaera sp. Ch08]|uniref:Uncharacterized protein n=1 Tax=Singulisphaera sp. Ch08 TaxID=3120278 RepID=A0AAU7CKA5_9BACT